MNPPTIDERLSDDRINEILDGFKVYPKSPVRLAREVKARRAAERADRHEQRKRLTAVVSTLEAIRTYADRGVLDLSPVPWLRDQLEDCRKFAEELRNDATGGTQTDGR